MQRHAGSHRLARPVWPRCRHQRGGGGIGRATALSFAKAGARVAILYRDEKRFETMRSALRALGAEPVVTVCDPRAGHSSRNASTMNDGLLGGQSEACPPFLRKPWSSVRMVGTAQKRLCPAYRISRTGSTPTLPPRCAGSLPRSGRRSRASGCSPSSLSRQSPGSSR